MHTTGDLWRDPPALRNLSRAPGAAVLEPGPEPTPRCPAGTTSRRSC
jgi:hypothetical protein